VTWNRCPLGEYELRGARAVRSLHIDAIFLVQRSPRNCRRRLSGDQCGAHNPRWESRSCGGTRDCLIRGQISRALLVR
jgi:hypothetical protein